MSFFEPWQQYTTPCVRQLAFSLASPNIIANIPLELNIKHPFQLHDEVFWEKQFFQYKTRLDQLDEDPTDLLSFLAKLKSTRLGLRFERFLLFWLLDKQYHAYKLIGHNIQHIEGKQTVGELDFIVFNENTQQIEHWEVAIKYYLAESDALLKQWYGLNRSDTLAKKLQHFTEKQFQFHTIHGQRIDKKYAVLKGQLFYPSNQALLSLPDWVNPLRRVGRWGHAPIDNLYRLTRHEWIAANVYHPSTISTWWYDGLYSNRNHTLFYMYRHAPFKLRYNTLQHQKNIFDTLHTDRIHFKQKI